MKERRKEDNEFIIIFESLVIWLGDGLGEEIRFFLLFSFGI